METLRGRERENTKPVIWMFWLKASMLVLTPWRTLGFPGGEVDVSSSIPVEKTNLAESFNWFSNCNRSCSSLRLSSYTYITNYYNIWKDVSFYFEL